MISIGAGKKGFAHLSGDLSYSKIKEYSSYLWMIASLCIPISAVLYIVAAYSPAPFWDQWTELLWLVTYYSGKAHFADLWRLHNEHCIFIPRLFFLVDFLLFGGTNMFLIPSIFLIQIFTCAMFIREVWVVSNMPRAFVCFLVGIYVTLLLCAVQMENFAWGFQVQFVLVFAGAVAAICCFARHGIRRTTGSNTRIWLVLGLLGAVIATFSMANGIFIWPLLVLMSFILGFPPREKAAIGAIFALCGIVLFSLGLKNQSLMNVFHQTRRVSSFFMIYLGSPFRPSVKVATIFGSIGSALAGAISLWYLSRIRTISRFQCVHLAIMWFIVLTAFATSIGRLIFPSDLALLSRYTTPALIFWASLLSLICYETSQRPRLAKYGGPALVIVVFALFVVYLLPAHVAAGMEARQTRIERDRAALALVVGVYDEEYLSKLHYFPSNLPLFVPFLRAHRLSMFNNDWAGLIGHKLSEEYMVSPDCSGEFVIAAPVSSVAMPSESGVGLRVYGWAWDSQSRKPSPLILLVDEEGLVQGIAKPSPQRDEVFGSNRQEVAKESNWFGYAVCRENSFLRAYALTTDKAMVSPLYGAHGIRGFRGSMRTTPSSE